MSEYDSFPCFGCGKNEILFLPENMSSCSACRRRHAMGDFSSNAAGDAAFEHMYKKRDDLISALDHATSLGELYVIFYEADPRLRSDWSGMTKMDLIFTYSIERLAQDLGLHIDEAKSSIFAEGMLKKYGPAGRCLLFLGLEAQQQLKAGRSGTLTAASGPARPLGGTVTLMGRGKPKRFPKLQNRNPNPVIRLEVKDSNTISLEVSGKGVHLYAVKDHYEKDQAQALIQHCNQILVTFD